MYINSICYLKWLNYMARRHATETNAPGHNPRSPFTRGDRAPEPHWKLRAMERWRPRGGKGASCTTQELSGSSWERKREGKPIQRRATHRRHVTSLGFDEEIDYICSKYNGRENGASRGGSVTYTQPTRLLPAEGMSHHTSVYVCVIACFLLVVLDHLCLFDECEMVMGTFWQRKGLHTLPVVPRFRGWPLSYLSRPALIDEKPWLVTS